MKKILIVGSDSDLGYEFSSLLAPKNDTKEISCENFYSGNNRLVDEFVVSFQPDIIIVALDNNIIGCNSSINSIVLSNFANNFKHLCKKAESISCTVLFVSSCSVYDKNEEFVHDVGMLKTSKTALGKSLIEAENFLLENVTKHFLIRSSWIYGIRDRKNLFFSLIDSIHNDTLLVSSCSSGSPTYAFDLALYCLDLLQTRNYGEYNASNEGICSLETFAKRFLSIIKPQTKINSIKTLISQADSDKNWMISTASLFKSCCHKLPSWQSGIDRFCTEYMSKSPNPIEKQHNNRTFLKKKILYKILKSKIISNLKVNIISKRKRKKILLVSQEMNLSGARICLLNMAKILLHYGYDVEVCAASLDGFEKEFKKIGINVKLISKMNYVRKNLFFAKFNLIICNTVLTGNIFSIVSSYTPSIWYIHEAGVLYLYDNRLVSRLFKNSSNIICVSEAAQKYIKDIYGGNAKIIPNFVDDCFNDYTANTKYNNKIKLLSLGWIDHNKNFGFVVDALSNLPANIRERYEYNFAGENNDFTALSYFHYLSKKIDCNNQIKYLGPIRNASDKNKLIATSDIIIIPSFSEACPLVALEGAMHSKPLLLSNGAGLDCFTKENACLRFNTHNVDTLSKIFIDIVNNKFDLKSLSSNARKLYLSEFSKSAYEKKFLSLVKEFIDNPKKIEKNYEFD